MIGLVEHLIALYIKLPSQEKSLCVEVLPKLPLPRPIVITANRQTTLARCNLNEHLNIQGSQLRYCEVGEKTVSPPRSSREIITIPVLKIGPIDKIGIQRIGPQSRSSSQKACLIRYPVADSWNIVLWLNRVWAQEHTSAIDSGITPEIMCISPRHKVAHIIAQNIWIPQAASILNREGASLERSNGSKKGNCSKVGEKILHYLPLE